MPLPKQIIDGSVRVLGRIPSSEVVTGWKTGTIGTGFILSVPSESLPGVRYDYLVTAHHVIDGQVSSQVQAANPFSPGSLYPAFAPGEWRQPLVGVDLALALIESASNDGGDQTLSGIAIEKWVMPPNNVPAIGATVHFVGYLEPLDRMMARAGTIGALEQKGVRHCEPEYDYECHLVDCRSYQGFSGSPVFFPQHHPILEEFPRSEILGDVPSVLPAMGSIASISVLCGMFTEHLDDDNADGVVTRYGVGVMLPSREIWRAVMSEEVLDERHELDARNKDAESSKEPRLRSASIGGEEFTKFERLAKQLVNTPKPQDSDGQ